MMNKKITIGNFQFAVYHLFIFLLIIFLYFFTRLYHLTALPVFCDEAIYVRWAQIMKNEPSLRFLPLQDGKQPLFMWLVIPALEIFHDPLLAGRMVSVFAGLATLIGMVVLPIIMNRFIAIGLMSGLLYVLAPFTLFFDRMALVDSLLSAFGIWSLILAILLGRYRRLDLAMILGMILGGAMLTKSPGLLFLAMSLPVSFIFMIKGKEKKDSFFLWGLKSLSLLGISLFFAFGIYNILRLGPSFHMIAIRNKDYVWPIAEIIKHPLDPLKPHIKDVLRYYWHYLTPPFIILGLIGILSVKKDLIFLLLISWWLLPLLGQSVFARVFTARYILFSLPVFLFFIAVFTARIWDFAREKVGKLAYLLLFLLIPALSFNWRLWRDPVKAPLPKDERAGYLEDWTAGQGIREIADYLKKAPREQGIVVGTEGHFGTLPDGLQIYLEGEKDITVLGIGHPVNKVADPLVGSRKAENKVYLVVNQSRFQMIDKNELSLIKGYEKPGGDKLLFFEVL